MSGLCGFGVVGTIGTKIGEATVAVVVDHPRPSREFVDRSVERDGRLLPLITEGKPVLGGGFLDHIVRQQLDGTQVVKFRFTLPCAHGSMLVGPDVERPLLPRSALV